MTASNVNTVVIRSAELELNEDFRVLCEALEKAVRKSSGGLLVNCEAVTHASEEALKALYVIQVKARDQKKRFALFMLRVPVYESVLSIRDTHPLECYSVQKQDDKPKPKVEKRHKRPKATADNSAGDLIGSIIRIAIASACGLAVLCGVYMACLSLFDRPINTSSGTPVAKKFEPKSRIVIEGRVRMSKDDDLSPDGNARVIALAQSTTADNFSRPVLGASETSADGRYRLSIEAPDGNNVGKPTYIELVVVSGLEKSVQTAEVRQLTCTVAETVRADFDLR